MFLLQTYASYHFSHTRYKEENTSRDVSSSLYKCKLEEQQKAKADKETKKAAAAFKCTAAQSGKKAPKKGTKCRSAPKMGTKGQPAVAWKLNKSSSSESECSADVDDTSSSGNSGSDSEDDADCQFCRWPYGKDHEGQCWIACSRCFL